ncbi:MAG: hypothetical protein ABJE66_09530 [Deltaproteobacteria bacterium]
MKVMPPAVPLIEFAPAGASGLFAGASWLPFGGPSGVVVEPLPQPPSAIKVRILFIDLLLVEFLHDRGSYLIDARSITKRTVLLAHECTVSARAKHASVPAGRWLVAPT